MHKFEGWFQNLEITEAQVAPEGLYIVLMITIFVKLKMPCG